MSEDEVEHFAERFGNRFLLEDAPDNEFPATAWSRSRRCG